MGFTEGFTMSMGYWVMLGVMTCKFPATSFKNNFSKKTEKSLEKGGTTEMTEITYPD